MGNTKRKVRVTVNVAIPAELGSVHIHIDSVRTNLLDFRYVLHTVDVVSKSYFPVNETAV